MRIGKFEGLNKHEIEQYLEQYSPKASFLEIGLVTWAKTIKQIIYDKVSHEILSISVLYFQLLSII